MIFPYDPPQQVGVLDEEHADPARHDLHPRRRHDRPDRDREAARRDAGAVGRADRRGARDRAAAARPSSASRKATGSTGRAEACARLAGRRRRQRRSRHGILVKAFTWWNGATWGTALLTRRLGDEVGRDDAGNIYYQDKKDPRRRWVIYNGANDGSRVPPDWQAVAARDDRRPARQGAPAGPQVPAEADRRT